MINLPTYWLTNVILAVFFVTIFNIILRIITRDSENISLTVLLTQLTGGLFSLFLSLFTEWSWPSNSFPYIILILACLIHTIYDYIQGICTRNLNVATMSITRQGSKIFQIAWGILVLSEVLSVKKSIAILLIMTSIFWLFFDKKKLIIDRYLFLAVFNSFLLFLAVVIAVYLNDKFNLLFYIATILIVPSSIIFAKEKFNFGKLKTIYSKQHKPITIAGLCWPLLIFFSVRAYNFGQFSVVSPATSLSVFTGAIAAYLFLNEKKDLSKYLLSGSLITVAIIIIANG